MCVCVCVCLIYFDFIKLSFGNIFDRYWVILIVCLTSFPFFTAIIDGSYQTPRTHTHTRAPTDESYYKSLTTPYTACLHSIALIDDR